ncbi:MAG: Rieske 2Fe-2S domain-containing protein [Bryobacteraceae bacterium]
MPGQPEWFSDALDAATGRGGFATAADASIAIGLLGAVASAATGSTDWQDVDPPARRIGLVHGMLMLSGTALFAASLILQKRSRGGGRIMAAPGYVVVAFSARLGGNLVYGQRLGVNHTAGQTFPAEFALVLAESELPEGKPTRAQRDGAPILLVRRGGKIFAVAETCSHLGGPLSEGKLVENTIQCPWHGSRLALEDGRVLDGPAVHPQPCLMARISNGQIEVCDSGCTKSC